MQLVETKIGISCWPFWFFIRRKILRKHVEQLKNLFLYVLHFYIEKSRFLRFIMASQTELDPSSLIEGYEEDEAYLSSDFEEIGDDYEDETGDFTKKFNAARSNYVGVNLLICLENV